MRFRQFRQSESLHARPTRLGKTKLVVRGIPRGPPGGQIGGKRRHDPHDSRLAGLGRLDLAESKGPFNEQRSLTDVAPPKSESFARTQPGVRQDGDNGRIAQSATAEKL